KSTHYVYRGRCIPFTMRDQQVTTSVSPVDPTTPPQTITYRTMRSVHGPVFAYASVKGAPVALAKAKGVDFRELGAALPFMRLAVNPTRGGGLIVSWNNKEAPGWRKGPTEWSNGSVHHAMILQNHLFEQARRTRGKVDLTELARAVNLSATTDLRGEDVYPWI